MGWKIDIGRDVDLVWTGVIDGDELGDAQLRTLRSKLSELGASDAAIERLLTRAANAWTDSAGRLVSPSLHDDVLIDGIFDLALSHV